MKYKFAFTYKDGETKIHELDNKTVSFHAGEKFVVVSNEDGTTTVYDDVVGVEYMGEYEG
jgi:adenosyl cobinamide kinase/adenosyl cobinamide phosphate guanylyltransferase